MSSQRLFDVDGLAADVEMTLGDGPLARPARVGFLTGMLAVWVCGGKPSDGQKEQLRQIAADAIERAAVVGNNGQRSRQTECGSCGSSRGHIEGRCRSCGGPWSPRKAPAR